MKIGIDFGTTNCTIARVDSQSKREQIRSPIPSIGYWQNERIVFGDEAKNELSEQRSDIYPLKDLKMLLGDRESINIFGNRVPVIDVISNLLKYLYVDVLKRESVVEVEELVIATPVLSSRKHRKSLFEACSRAGFRNTRIVYEPTAALIGSNFRQIKESERDLILVVDWGGGTLDITVVQKTDNNFREIAVGGDNFSLGGSRMDQEITKRVLNDHPALKQAIFKINGGFDRLTSEIESAKIEILGSLDDEEELISPAWLSSHEEFLVVSSKHVNEVIESFTEEAIDVIVRTFEKARIRHDDITHILYAGGVCKCAKIKHAINDKFPYANEIAQSTPQALTGIGNARLADQGYNIRLATNFGVRQCDNQVCILLEQEQEVSANRFRQAEFLVTDVRAPEAIFDFGTINEIDGWAPLQVRSDNFVSMKQMFIPVGNGSKSVVADHILLFTGLGDDLTIITSAIARASRKKEDCSISGIPLSINLLRGES
jgi:molecular chaperone DnaK (HSP70)